MIGKKITLEFKSTRYNSHCSRSVKGSRRVRAKTSSNGFKETATKQVIDTEGMVAANGGDMIQRVDKSSNKNNGDTKLRESSSANKANNADISAEANSIETNDIDAIDVAIKDEQNNLNLNQKDQDVKTDTYSKKFERNVLGTTYYRAWPQMEKSSDTQT